MPAFCFPLPLGTAFMTIYVIDTDAHSCTYIHTHSHTCTLTFIHMYVHTHTGALTHIHMLTYSHTHMLTFIHIYVHTHTCLHTYNPDSHIQNCILDDYMFLSPLRAQLWETAGGCWRQRTCLCLGLALVLPLPFISQSRLLCKLNVVL